MTPFIAEIIGTFFSDPFRGRVVATLSFNKTKSQRYGLDGGLLTAGDLPYMLSGGCCVPYSGGHI